MKWVLLAVVVFGGCRKEQPSRYDAALAQHRALVLAQERPDSKKFDDVLAALKAIPADDASAADAKKLADIIERARVRVRRPLATVHAHETDLPESVAAQTRACAALAEQLARDGGATPSVVRALDDCRKRIEKLDLAYHDAHEPNVDDVSQRFEAMLDAGTRH